MLGYSAGSALAGLLQLGDQLTENDVVVIIFHDHGSRYVGKIFNDDWMRERGFLDTELTVKDILRSKRSQQLMTVDKNDLLREVIEIMRSADISQLPVRDGETLIGSVTETAVLTHLLEAPDTNGETSVGDIMGAPFPTVEEDLPLSQLNRVISKTTPAVIARDETGQQYIVTNYDILQLI